MKTRNVQRTTSNSESFREQESNSELLKLSAQNKSMRSCANCKEVSTLFQQPISEIAADLDNLKSRLFIRGGNRRCF
jgi:hypothetical protein